MIFRGLLLLAASLAAFAGEFDAHAISQRIQAVHMPFGIVVSPVFDSPTGSRIVGYTRCGDSALWTGHYLAAEALRYKVTRSQESLAAVERALSGLQMLTDVTARNLLARCAVPQDSPYAKGITSEEKHNGVFRTTLARVPYYWIGNTSRDQYSGALFGLAMAYEMVDDATVRAGAAALATRLINELVARKWILIFPDFQINAFTLRPDQRLAFLQIGKRLNPERFAALYRSQADALADDALWPVLYDSLDDNSSYFKFNLNAINLLHLIRFESDAMLRENYLAAYRVQWSVVRNHGNAHFDAIDLAINGSDTRRDEELRGLLWEWLQRPRRDVPVDLRGVYRACGDNRACEPVPVRDRVPTDFLWQRSPFQLYGGGAGLIEEPGIDYILPYWMARACGVTPD